MNASNSNHDSFRIRNAQRWAPGGRRPYLIALAAVVIAFGVRHALHAVLQAQFPFVSFTVAAVLVEFFFGLGPALVAVFAGLFLGTYFFVPPFGSLAIPEPLDLVFVGAYLVVVLLVVCLIEDLQRSRYALSLMKDVLQSRLEMLERSNAERTLAERSAQESGERFRALASSFPQILYMRRVDGEFEYLNEQFYRYTGLTPGSLDAVGWIIAVHPDEATAVSEACERVGRSGAEEMLQFRLRLADGSYENFAGPLCRLQGGHGLDIKWVGTVVKSSAAHA